MPARHFDAVHRGGFQFYLIGYYTDTSCGMPIAGVIDTMITNKPTQANITLQFIP